MSSVTDELAWLPAWRLASEITSGNLSAETVARAALDRIAALNPQLHSFITIASEQAIDQARAADDAVRNGQLLGPLHGVPIALKDDIWTRDMPSTGGSLVYQNFIPSHDATLVERLRAAGAIIVGKTQLPEFAMWPRSVNRVGEEARNPHDPQRISGASSGGSGACVAAGMTPLAVGSDGGGSVRIPAALNGVFGLHPTPGSVPDHGTFSYSPHASLGPMTRDVRDAALLFQVMTDPGRQSADYVAELDKSVEGLRVAWTGNFGWIAADPRVVATARAAAFRLAEAGAIVEEPTIHIDDIWPAFGTYTRGYALYEPGIRLPYVQSAENLAKCLQNPDLLMPGVAQLLQAPLPSAAEYQEAKAMIKAAQEQLSRIFAHHDVICSPTMSGIAPPIPDGWGHPYDDDHMGTHYTSVVNVSHGTAASFPCGLVDELPVGLQVVAPAGQESVVLRMCRALEIIQPWAVRPLLCG